VAKIRRKKKNTVGAQDYESNCTQIGVGHIPCILKRKLPKNDFVIK
jgi:hypothetical protein